MEWSGILASLIEDIIETSGLQELPDMHAFVDRRNNGVCLCTKIDGPWNAPENFPIALVHCKLRDVRAFDEIAASIERLLELRAKARAALERHNIDTSDLRKGEGMYRYERVDQLAFLVAMELESMVKRLFENTASS